MSYGALGFGLDVGCPPGEQFDFTSMQCVTAGQAITPVPPLPSTPPPLPPLPPPPPPPPAPPPSQSMTALLREYAPWLIGGAVVLGAAVILTKGSGTRATPNARVPKHKHKCVCAISNKRRQRSSKRPPKQWFRDCVREVSASGSAVDPQSVCGATWYRKMGPKGRKAAKVRHYGRNPQFAVRSSGRTIAHVTGRNYEEALRDFNMSRRAGWYPSNSVLVRGGR